MIILVFCTDISLGALSADEWFEKGIEAFKWRRIDDAAACFIKAEEENPSSPVYPFYAGLCYHQSGRFTDAEAAYERSLSLGGDTDDVLLNRGNLRWKRGNIQGAVEDYTTVIEGGGKNVSSALLNRANLELNQEKYDESVRDYSLYLKREPDSPDRKKIEKVIALVNEKIQEAMIAEARRIQEEARRQALLEEVRGSLGDSGENTKSISAGSENLREEFEESDLED